MNNSPFKEGRFRHESGFEILVKDGLVYVLTENLPLSMRLSEFFTNGKWRKVDE